MGLDMYAYRVASNAAFSDFEYDKTFEPTEFFYWRKHHDLHGWMEELYRAKGGTKEDFNCVPVRLTYNDLMALERAVLDNTLPKTTGFFFGNNPPDDESKLNDLKFIADAKLALSKGYAVYYDSWW
jgi:hypothetical protein